MSYVTSQHIAVVGSGAAGLSAAWLLARTHRVTLIEKDSRLGGHAHTATVPDDNNLKVDTGFIVYNEPSYPNMTRWFSQLGVVTEDSDMSFAVSRDNGNFEYAGGPVFGLIAQPALPFRRRFWRMLMGLLRFYREARTAIPADSTQSLGEFLQEHRYQREFIDDHLLPFGAAIWSTSKNRMLDYPAAAFIRFCDNHGLLQISNRPQWRTVTGGSEQYVSAVATNLGKDSIVTGFDTVSVGRHAEGISIRARDGRTIEADQVVLAMHADQALAVLDNPSEAETAGLSPFAYEKNRAYLHRDPRFLPRRRRAWCSWNYVETDQSDSSQVSVSYWMNRLQNLQSSHQYIVSLNPDQIPGDDQIIRVAEYEHPVFTAATWSAQQVLWNLQGQLNTWYCGSYFGSGFHEDAVQSGLAVAEQISGTMRPWQIENPSGRIVVSSSIPEGKTPLPA